jgi:hypothetical protein
MRIALAEVFLATPQHLFVLSRCAKLASLVLRLLVALRDLPLDLGERRVRRRAAWSGAWVSRASGSGFVSLLGHCISTPRRSLCRKLGSPGKWRARHRAVEMASYTLPTPARVRPGVSEPGTRTDRVEVRSVSPALLAFGAKFPIRRAERVCHDPRWLSLLPVALYPSDGGAPPRLPGVWSAAATDELC